MTITQLEYAVAVATYKSFVAAAEKCFVTQPTLSMQIQKLEEELGVKLFDRNKHPIAVTATGKAIIEQARKTLAESEKIIELIQHEQNKLEGNFKFAVIHTLAPYILPALLDNYSNQYPKVKLKVQEMETDKIVTALLNDEIDLALISTPLHEQGIKEYPLFLEDFVAYFHEDEKALKKEKVIPSDISLDRIWLLNEGHCMRNQVIDLCSDQVEKLQVKKPFYYDSSNVGTLIKMVDRNRGMAVLPEYALPELTNEQLERIRRFEDPVPSREISLVYSDHFVKFKLLESLKDEIMKLIPESMRVQKKNRKVLRIQSAKL